MYNTSGPVESAYEYIHDVYDNALENVSLNITSCEGTIFHVIGRYMRYPF